MSPGRRATRRARIRFLTTAEGGRYSAPVSGVRPQLAIGSVSTSCIVDFEDPLAMPALGESIEARLTLMFPEEYRAAFSALASVKLFEGSKLVATGIFID